jgi:hypothetical protein
MKKILLALIALGIFQCSFAQTDSIGFRRSGDDDYIISIGGYDILMGQQGPKVKKFKMSHKPKSSLDMFSGMEMGWCNLVGTDYAGYAQQDFLDCQNGLSSFHFGMDIVKATVALNQSRNLYFVTGVQMNNENYTFRNHVTLGYENGKIIPIPISSDYKKSKLVTTYFAVPLGFKLDISRKTSLSAYGFGGVLMESYTKYKKPKHKDHGIDGLNPFQYGVGASLLFDDYGIFAKYSTSPLFESGKGPKAYSFSVGMYFDI